MTVCCICLEDISYPCCCVPCGHVFCGLCIQNWSQVQSRRDDPQCPQCRTIMEYIQPIRMEASDIRPIIGGLNDRLRRHHEWEMAIRRFLLEFMDSQFGNLYFSLRDFLSSVPVIQQMYTDLQKVKRSVVDVIQEIRTAEGVENRILLLRHHTQKGAMVFQEKLMQLPSAACVKDSWKNLTDIQKLFIIMAVVVFLTVAVTDYSFQNGVFHTLIIPLLQTVFGIIYQVFYSVLYVLFRPVMWVWNCFGLFVLMLVDIVRTILIGVVMVIILILSIPWILATSVITLVKTVSILVVQIFIGLIKTVVNIVPVFAIVYFCNTNVQQWTNQFLLKLQRNH